jgi:outer membrane protein assembly factor BamB
MRIICLPDGFEYYTKSAEFHALYARLDAVDVKFNNDGFEYFDYGRWYWKSRFVTYQGVEYTIEKSSDANIVRLTSFRDRQCNLVDGEGKRLQAKPEVLWLLTHQSFDKRKARFFRDNKIVGYICINRGNWILTLADLGTGEIKSREGLQVENEYLLKDVVLLFNGSDYHIYCLNYDLQTLWTYKPDINFADQYVRGPEVYQDLVLVSYGPSRHESVPAPDYNGKQFADEKRSYDSNLYALNLKDGSLCWHVVIPKTIDNMVVLDDRLYISSTNEIHVLNPQTGNTLQVIDTGLSPEVDQYLNPSCLHIQGDKLYFCHQVDACLQVYNLDDLQLLKSINIPAPYTIKDFEYYHEATDKLYFNLKWRFPRLYYHMSPALELDPNDLDSEMELIKGPPVEIELRPSETNPDESEVWITMRNVPLDEAMVYAEMHTEDQAYYHGTHGMFDASHKTENFNGKVHFRYSGSDRPLVEVHEKMKILEERFIDWGRTIAFASTNPAEPATLDAQYQE